MSPARIVLVTGASSGIGQSIARRLAADGHRVFGTARAPREATASEAHGVELLPLDVRDDASVSACVAEIERRAGAIDVLVNNAGTMRFGPIEEVPLDDARALFDTNFFGVARMTCAVLPSMRARRAGTIVNVGSIAGQVAIPMNGWYAASKHALAGWTEALRHEVRHLGIRVTLVEPGDFQSRLFRDDAFAPARFDDYGSLRRAILPKLQAMLAAAPSPAPVAELVARLAVADAPAPRHPIGGLSWLLPKMRALMPAGAFEGGTRRKFGLDRLA
jgi:NAD(P)-dependent dehydrogenase (short-subunit alcohol dehydrogenase family)